MFIILLCFVVYYEDCGNIVSEQVLDSSFIVEKLYSSGILILEFSAEIVLCFSSDAGRTYNCFWSDTQDGPLSNGTTVEPGAVHTYSASVIWKSPTPGRFKCNIDASFASHLNRVWIGKCICDEFGQLAL
jgi:hypothetical protein